MVKRLNCWEFKNCGREKDGLMTPILGECPVAKAMKFDGLNDGIGAGRACWMVPDSACVRASVKGRPPCHSCEFYKRVVFEQDQEICFKFTSANKA
jgi:hypothetical protein